MMNPNKYVIKICAATNKKCFATYTDCVKFARRVSRRNALARRKVGSEAYRNLSPLDIKEMNLWKRCKSVYLCEHCNYWHFSSVKKPPNNK